MEHGRRASRPAAAQTLPQPPKPHLLDLRGVRGRPSPLRRLVGVGESHGFLRGRVTGGKS